MEVVSYEGHTFRFNETSAHGENGAEGGETHTQKGKRAMKGGIIRFVLSHLVHGALYPNNGGGYIPGARAR